MNKAKVFAIAAASVGIASVVGIGTVAAQTGAGTTLADKIATQFNLNRDEVQKVIDQDHQDRHAQMEKSFEDRLQAAVDAGKITADQKAKIIAKRADIEKDREANRDAFRSMTKDQRKAEMEKKKAELEQWAKDNNVPVEYLKPGRGGHGPQGMGMGHRGMMGGDEDAQQAPAN